MTDPAVVVAGGGPTGLMLAAELTLAGTDVDIVVLEVGPVLAITDAFVITSGANSRQVKTIAEEVELQVKRAGGPAPLRTEGLSDLQWVLLDYGDFVVHIFLQETRDYYDLERLWGDAAPIDWQAIVDDLPSASAVGE